MQGVLPNACRTSILKRIRGISRDNRSFKADSQPYKCKQRFHFINVLQRDPSKNDGAFPDKI